MNLDYLNNIIPKRWILSLHYWLPFFKTPSIFYFECRSFINELIRLDAKYFWEKFPNLISIFERTVSNEVEKNLSLAIISKIFDNEKEITHEHLNLLFSKFNPDLKRRTSILDRTLSRIPDKIYSDYFKSLNPAHCRLLDLKWCAQFKVKFKLEDRLTFILTLPPDKLITYQSTLQLLIQELEEQVLNPQSELFESLSNETVNKQLIEFILKHELTLTPKFIICKKIIFSDIFIQAYINQSLKKNDPIVIFYLLKLDIPTRFSFFENFLVNDKNFQQTSQYFFKLSQDDQWSNMVNHLINSVYCHQEAENNEPTAEEKKMTMNDWDSFFLIPLEKAGYSLDLFQFLAVQALMKKPLDLKSLKNKFNLKNLPDDEYVSIACQAYVTEYSIREIKNYIQTLIKHSYNQNTQDEKKMQPILSRLFQEQDIDYSSFCEKFKRFLDTYLSVQSEVNLDFLKNLLSFIELIVNNPLIREYKIKQFIEWNKNQKEAEEKSDACRELKRRVFSGEQTLVSFQVMHELFGSQASIIQEKWINLGIGIHFFDANVPEEYKIAEKTAREASKAKKFNREYNDFSYLSNSPSSVSYLYG